MKPSKRKQGRNSVSFVVPYSQGECHSRLQKINGMKIHGMNTPLRLVFRIDAKKQILEFEIGDGGRDATASATGKLYPIDVQQTHVTFTTHSMITPVMLGIPSIMMGLCFFSASYSDLSHSIGVICWPLLVAASTAFAIVYWNVNLETTYKLKQRIISVFDIEPGVSDMRLSRQRNIGAIVIVFAAFMLQWAITLTRPEFGCLLPVVCGVGLTIILLKLDKRS